MHPAPPTDTTWLGVLVSVTATCANTVVNLVPDTTDRHDRIESKTIVFVTAMWVNTVVNLIPGLSDRHYMIGNNNVRHIVFISLRAPLTDTI